MYKIEYLPIALQDMVELSSYIGKELKNPTAAAHLAEKMVEAIDQLAVFPYMNSVYQPIKPLKYEYRKIVVDNYLIFYTVNETSKIVTVHRVIYGKRNYNKVL